MTHMRPSGPPARRVRHSLGRLLPYAVLAALVVGGTAGIAAAFAPSIGPGPGAPPPALGVPTPTTNTSVLDLGMALNVSVNATQITGGSGNLSALSYTWLGLPANCTSASLASYTCYPTATGTFSISVQVNDSGNGRSGASGSVSVTVNTDPTITSFTASATSVQVNSTLTFTTTATGGTAPYSYFYSGLPSGCTGTATAAVSCAPTFAQAHNVTVYVVDAVGMASNTPYVLVNVTAPPAPSPTTHPTIVEWAIIAVILVVGLGLSAVLFVRAGRVERTAYRRAPPPPGPGTGPGSPPGPGGGTPPPGPPPSS